MPDDKTTEHQAALRAWQTGTAPPPGCRSVTLPDGRTWFYIDGLWTVGGCDGGGGNAEDKTTEIDAAVAKARSRTLMAAKNLSRLMGEFDGEHKYCQEALTEVLDAADQLETLEALQSQTTLFQHPAFTDPHRPDDDPAIRFYESDNTVWPSGRFTADQLIAIAEFMRKL